MRPPAYWRDKADEALAMASEMTSDESRQTLLSIAEQYENLVYLAEQNQAYERRRISRSWALSFALRSP